MVRTAATGDYTDPAVLRQVEAQIDLLSADQLPSVLRSVQARMQPETGT